MKKAQIHGTKSTIGIVTKAYFVVVFVLTLAVMAMLPGAVLGQDELPNEVTWQKTQTSAQDPLPGQEGRQADIVLPPKKDNCLWVKSVPCIAIKPVGVVVLHGYNGGVYLT